VPDLVGFAAANDLAGKAEIREAIGEKFPKHIYHSIVSIGALIAHREQDHWAVDALGAQRRRDRPVQCEQLFGADEQDARAGAGV
jgi:hypothetical protein